MKLQVTCLVNSVNSNALPDAEATTKEVEVQNPNAMLSSLRAKAALAFRVSLNGFSMVYQGPRAAAVDLTNEKKMLKDCGLEEGDRIVLLSKRVREANGSEEASAEIPVNPSPSAAGAAEKVAAAEASEEEQRRKAARVEGATAGAVEMVEDDTDSENPFAEADDSSAMHDSVAMDDDDDYDDEEHILEEGEVDIDLGAATVSALLGPSADAEAGELYGRLLEVVPNLVELRQEFLSNPQAVMERIQREDPTLFQLITAHQAAFVGLMNNEAALTTIQAEKEGGFYDGTGDEELDEEAMENLLGMLAGGAGGMEGDDDDMTDEDDEAMGGFALDPADLAAMQAGGDGAQDTKARILAFAPSEEDEQKIQQLVQLGFAYDVCKVAFYLSHRSIDRAANMLFENPPQL